MLGFTKTVVLEFIVGVAVRITAGLF